MKVVKYAPDGSKDVQKFENVDLGDDIVSALQAIEVLGVDMPSTIPPIAHAAAAPSAQEAEGLVEIREGLESTQEFIQEAYAHVTEKAQELMDQYAKGVEGIPTQEKHKYHRLLVSDVPRQPHAVAFRGKKTHGCGKKKFLKALKEDDQQDTVESIKSWGQDLYEDVSSIDIKDAFKVLGEPDVMSAVGDAFFAGMFLVTLVAVILRHRKKQLIKLADEETEEEEEKLLSEKN